MKINSKHTGFVDLNVPIDLCFYAEKNNCVNQLGTYCWLKSKCDGYIKEPMLLVKDYIKETGWSERTFFNHKKWLIENNWLIIPQKGGVRVISFQNLLMSLGINHPKQRGAIFHGDFHHFKGFIYAAIITYAGRYKKYHSKRTGTKYKGGASRRFLGSFDLPHSYLAKVLGVSKSTAQNYRKYAEACLQIEQVKHEFNLSTDQVKLYRTHSGDSAKTLVIEKGKVYEQRPSAIWSNVVIKRRKK